MKRASGSRKRCIYCGAEKDLTVDHVPPKLLLMLPYPQNLITVPASEHVINLSRKTMSTRGRCYLLIFVRPRTLTPKRTCQRFYAHYSGQAPDRSWIILRAELIAA